MSLIHLALGAVLATSGSASQATTDPTQSATPPAAPTTATPTLNAPAAPTPDQPQPTTIPLELLASRPLIRITVNGHGPLPFLIGHEDQPSVIDGALAETLKIKAASKGAPDPTVEIGFGPGSSLKVSAKVVTGSVTNGDFAPNVRPRGVISLSAWKDYLLTLDYTKWKISFERGVLPEPNGKDVFPLTASRDIMLPLTLPNRSIECRLDPLFPGGLLLPAAEVAEVPIDGTLRDWGKFNTGDETLYVKEARLAATLSLGGYEMRTPVVMLADGVATPTVGTQWLRRFAVTYDLANARARLERPSFGTKAVAMRD
jgi:hypothetical protein